MQNAFALSGLIIAAFLVSIPCGYLRENFRKFSIPWLFMAHLPIPMVIILRHLAGFGWPIIPLTLLSVIAGQIVGARLKRRMTHEKETTKG